MITNDGASDLSPAKAVLVHWKDCTSCDAWVLPAELVEIGCPIIHTLGWMTIDNKELICVSVARETAFGKVAGTLTIPRAQIVEMWELQIR